MSTRLDRRGAFRVAFATAGLKALESLLSTTVDHETRIAKLEAAQESERTIREAEQRYYHGQMPRGG